MTGLRLCLVFIFAVVTACAPMPPRSSEQGLLDRQVARETELARRGQWSFTGRIAVSQGGQGGSGSIEWRQDGADFDIRLSAPISKQTWRLGKHGALVRLEGLSGGVREGSDAEILLQQATGWRIPVTAMIAWARGARAPGAAELDFADNGLPATLKQAGWVVEYRNWSGQDSALPLPGKVFATLGDARVRLVIASWQSP